MKFLPTYGRKHFLRPRFHDWIGDGFDEKKHDPEGLRLAALLRAKQDGQAKAIPQSSQTDQRRRGSDTDQMLLADIRIHSKSLQVERAKRLGIAQAEVSRSAARLREALHIVIVRRTGDGTEFTLTPSGRRILQEAA